jgi:NTP pyrophosphatase (non-canonical NTP hydrolase)
MLNKLISEIHENAVEHGWWDDERSFGDIISLCHSELSEALEEYRNNRGPRETYYSGNGCESVVPTVASSKPEGIPIELADCIIRILDYCGKENIDIEAAIRIKHKYNKSRPYKHGGKVI